MRLNLSDFIFKNRTLNYLCRVDFADSGVNNVLPINAGRIPMKKLISDCSVYLPRFMETPVLSGIRDDFVPQGLEIIGERFFISAYAGNHKNSHNSVIYVCSANGNTECVWQLPFEAHVGGLAFDGTNLWVCSGGNEITAFDYKKCLELSNLSENPALYSQRYSGEIKASKCIDISQARSFVMETGSITSFCTYYNGILFTGSFSFPPKYMAEPVCFGYDIKNIDDNKTDCENLCIAAKHSCSIPDKIQGLCFFSYGGCNYAALSRAGSSLIIFKYEDNIKNENSNITFDKPYITIKLPCMLEQIQERDGRLYLLFESSAKKYANPFRRIVSRLLTIDLKMLLGTN